MLGINPSEIEYKIMVIYPASPLNGYTKEGKKPLQCAIAVSQIMVAADW